MAFRDRTQAGRLLAERLERYRAVKPMVLGLARGGVPVAAEVARALDADLDLVVARKLGAPGNPEYAIGAIAEGGAVFVRREAVAETGMSEGSVAALAELEATELARRVRIYRGGRPMPDLTGRTVIVVDDGVATGATARAAARSARVRGASHVVLAAPVIAAASAPELRADYDDVVAVDFPGSLHRGGALVREVRPGIRRSGPRVPATGDPCRSNARGDTGSGARVRDRGRSPPTWSCRQRRRAS